MPIHFGPIDHLVLVESTVGSLGLADSKRCGNPGRHDGIPANQNDSNKYPTGPTIISSGLAPMKVAQLEGGGGTAWFRSLSTDGEGACLRPLSTDGGGVAPPHLMMMMIPVRSLTSAAWCLSNPPAPSSSYGSNYPITDPPNLYPTPLTRPSSLNWVTYLTMT